MKRTAPNRSASPRVSTPRRGTRSVPSPPDATPGPSSPASRDDLLEACVLPAPEYPPVPAPGDILGERIDDLGFEDAPPMPREEFAERQRNAHLGVASTPNQMPFAAIQDATTIPLAYLPRDAARLRRMEMRNTNVLLHNKREELPVMVVESTQFYVMSFEELKSKAVCVVNIPSNEIKENTVNDPRMGVLNAKHNCATCNGDIDTCPGHLGMIILNVPILHPEFIDVIINVLSCMRIGCGGMRLSPERIRDSKVMRLSGLKRLEKLAQLSAREFCACHACNRGILSQNSKLMEMALKKSDAQTLNSIVYNKALSQQRKSIMFKIGNKGEELAMPIEDIDRVFRSITPEMARVMGFSDGMHPKNFIMQALPVVPPNIRPPTIERGETRDEHLTAMYIDIVKINNEISNPELSNVAREDKIFELKKRISYFIDNSDNTYTQGGNGQPYKSIQQRVSGKTELRRYAMGKRVNFSARTVIGPDTSIKWGEVVIPRAFARTLTYPVRIFDANLEEMQRKLREGRVLRVESGGGVWGERPFEITDRNRDTYQLKVNDIAHRQLEDGDIVFVNRQPTLHSLGMRAFRAVIRDQKTIGLHPDDTGAFNADFDGDEMNLHVPQSLEAIAEAIFLASAQACFMDPASDRPSVGAKLDIITGAYLMTMKNRDVNPELFNDCIANFVLPPNLTSVKRRAMSKGLPLYCTRTLFSTLLPHDFNYRQNGVEIVDGILVQGTIMKKHIGSESRSISHYLYKNYGVERASAFITDSTRLILRWLNENNITMGVAECLPHDIEARDRIVRETVAEAKMRIEALGPAPDPRIDPLGAEAHERKVRDYIQIQGTIAERIKDQYDPENSLIAMVESGAKGGKANLAQITSIIGQQFLHGRRIEPRDPNGRVLSYFSHGSTDIAAKGFIQTSYLEGASPAEMFFIMLSGREGLVNTATTTADVGAINHNMAKAMEDLVVHYDGSVRNAQNSIVQPLYGYDGLDGSELMNTKMPNGEALPTFLDLRDCAAMLNAQAEQFARDYVENVAEDDAIRKNAHIVAYLRETGVAS